MQILDDAIDKEKDTSADSSTEKQTSNDSTTNVSEDDETQDEEELGSGIENYDNRFKQLYREKKEIEREKAELESRLENNKSAEPESEDEFVPNTWNEVFEKLEQRLINKQETESERLAQVEQQINSDLQEVKKLYPDIDDDDMWDFMAENKIVNVYEAAAKFLKDNPNVNENKQVSAKMGSKNTSGKAAVTYEQIHNKSLDDLTLPE